MVVYLIVIHGIWGNRVTLFDGVSRVVVVGITVDSGGQVKLILNID